MKMKEENDATDWHEKSRKWEKEFWKRVTAAIVVMMAGLLILLEINTIPLEVVRWYIIVAFPIFGGCIAVWLHPAYKRNGIFDQIEKQEMEK